MKKYLLIGAIALLAIIGGLILSGNQASKNIEKSETGKSQEIYVDVRTDSEWQQGHLDGAVHFDLAKLQQGEMPNLPKDAPLALYCHSGNRAGQALAILEKNGFSHLRNAGGLANLQSQGNKVCLGEIASCN